MHANACTKIHINVFKNHTNLCKNVNIKMTQTYVNNYIDIIYIGMLFIPEYYMVRIVDVFVTGTLHIFGNNNINLRILCSIIGKCNVI